MKKIVSLTFCLFFFALLHAQSVAHTRCQNFGKGVNLSNWLEAYWQVGFPTANGYNKSFLSEIRQSGIRSIRLPINFESVVDSLPPFTVDTSHVLFQRVDSVIAWANELDMNLIIDNHHSWPFTDSTWRDISPRMATLWAAVAKKYAHLDPDRFTFEMLNEPPMPIHNDSLRYVYFQCIDSIRAYAPYHSIVASPAFAGIGLAFVDFIPLPDTNIIYTFHSYDPYPFTHQGFSWSNPYYAPGATFPGGAYDFLFPLSWDQYEIWKSTYNLPTFLGEFGVGSYADEQSRCHWIDTIGRRIHKNDLSWFYWDVQYDFQMFNGSIIHKDSIIPCFRQALRLYDDSLSTFSIEENITEAISIYPNPATDKFTCTVDVSSPALLYFYDYKGRCLYNEKFNSQTEIDVRSFPGGIYYLKIIMGNKTLFKKIILNKG